MSPIKQQSFWIGQGFINALCYDDWDDLSPEDAKLLSQFLDNHSFTWWSFNGDIGELRTCAIDGGMVGCFQVWGQNP